MLKTPQYLYFRRKKYILKIIKTIDIIVFERVLLLRKIALFYYTCTFYINETSTKIREMSL